MNDETAAPATAPGLNQPALSVVIPSFNSAPWLPSTITALADAVRAAGLRAQVVVVDDGSTDDTREVVAEIGPGFPGVVEYVAQDNRGRFLARWEGLQRATAPLTLLLDSRVVLAPHSLAHVHERLRAHPDDSVWNAHIDTDPAAPLVGRFWEVPTHVFWAQYLRRPRAMAVTVENFDRVPKGTTAFMGPTALLREAFLATWPEDDAHLVSDDTKLLRWLVAEHAFRLDPGFAAVYRPRTTLRGFVGHTYDRGTLFVDSYAGTTLLRSALLVLLAVLPPLAVVTSVVLSIAGIWIPVVIVLAVVLVAVLLPAVVAGFNRCPPRAIGAYLVILPCFAGPFWLGIARGVVLHRARFADVSRPPSAKRNLPS